MSQEVVTNTQDLEQGEKNLQAQANGGSNGATDYEAEFNKLKSANERLLAESQKNKTRFDRVTQAEQELADLKQEKVDRDGNADEKIKFYKERYDLLEESNNSLRTNIVMNKLEKRFKDIAPDCKNVGLVINNPDYSEQISAAINAKDLEVDSEILKSIYLKDKETNDFIYGGKVVPKMVGGGALPDTKKVAPNLDKMTPDEYKDWIKKTETK